MIDNKVARSGLITLDLEKWYSLEDIVPFDLKDYLHAGLVLREKDFRHALETHDWTRYSGKTVAVYCSSDAIVASWAYMLVAVHASRHAESVFFGSTRSAALKRFMVRMDEENWSVYSGKKVLLKGCSGVGIPAAAYLYATQKLLPYVERIMYGEACSFVPVYRRNKEEQAERTV